jgi:superfamily II DNA or RNA helicase
MIWETRSYQQEAVAACLAGFVEKGKASVMLESPVGSGKTYMALETIHLLQQLLGRRLRVDWVAPRRHLLQQVMEANMELHRDAIRPVSLFEKTPPEADLVVLDEAHHEATQSCVLLYEKMKSTYTLGLSATPLRTDRMKLSFQDTVTTCSIDRLIREGFLSPFHSYMLPHYGPQIVGECYLNSPERWGKSLVFFHTVLECCQFQKVLTDAGMPCEVVTSESDKDRQLEDFVAGKVWVIANVSMLTEGFDQPDVQTIFARDASRLPTIQMCGRGLRKADGKQFCNVVQSAKTSYLFEKVTPAQRRFKLMNGQWMALQDGTEAIEATIKLSLALLERRERMRNDRRRAARGEPRRNSSRHASSGAGAGEARSFGDTHFLPPFYSEFEDVYRQLYWYYDLCNQHGWSGTLPPVALTLNRSTRPTHVAGYAQRFATSVNGVPYHAISLTLNICSRNNTASLMTLLLHEMTHIWQFTRGQRGGHGKGFRDEMLRLGIDEAGQCLRDDSPADRIGREAEMRYPQLTARLRECLTSPHRSSKEEDFAFFRLIMGARSL